MTQVDRRVHLPWVATAPGPRDREYTASSKLLGRFTPLVDLTVDARTRRVDAAVRDVANHKTRGVARGVFPAHQAITPSATDKRQSCESSGDALALEEGMVVMLTRVSLAQVRQENGQITSAVKIQYPRLRASLRAGRMVRCRREGRPTTSRIVSRFQTWSFSTAPATKPAAWASDCQWLISMVAR